MSLRMMGLSAGLALAALSLATPASAATAHAAGLNGAPTSWARMMTHRHTKVHRRTRMNKGAGSASSSAPNGRGIGMGPTGQPSGVK